MISVVDCLPWRRTRRRRLAIRCAPPESPPAISVMIQARIIFPRPAERVLTDTPASQGDRRLANPARGLIMHTRAPLGIGPADTTATFWPFWQTLPLRINYCRNEYFLARGPIREVGLAIGWLMRMSNFTFLPSERLDLYDPAAKAESVAHSDARAAGFYARRGLEAPVRPRRPAEPELPLPIGVRGSRRSALHPAQRNGRRWRSRRWSRAVALGGRAGPK